jgi:hypothetical protein
MNKHKLIDFTERVGATFVFTFLALATTTSLSDPTQLKAAAIAGALSAGKYVAVAANKFLASEPSE